MAPKPKALGGNPPKTMVVLMVWRGGRYHWIILANDLIQGNEERMVSTKSKENLSKAATGRVQTLFTVYLLGLHIICILFVLN